MPSNQLRDITTELGFLSLLQISDSSFPTGAYSQSYGLETYVQKGLVTCRETLRTYITTYLGRVVATSDCLAFRLAYQASAKGDLDALLELDQVLAAQKLARESREASAKTGSRMLRTAAQLFSGPMLMEYNQRISAGNAHGHHALVFGLTAQSIGLGEREGTLAFVYSSMAGMVNNALRLIPLGQNDGQWVLKALQEVILETVENCSALTHEDLGASAPAVEIRCMEHEGLYSRLFMS